VLDVSLDEVDTGLVTSFGTGVFFGRKVVGANELTSSRKGKSNDARRSTFIALSANDLS
jgi:hypothetical protein